MRVEKKSQIVGWTKIKKAREECGAACFPFLLLRASLSWLLLNGLLLLISAVSRGRSCKEHGFC